MIYPDTMTLVDYVVYCNSKCHYWFRHSLTFLCMDKHYFKHCALLDNIFVGKLFTRWSCAWFSTIMSIISQFLFSLIRTLLSLGTVVMFSWHYHRCWRRGGFIACLLGGCLLILFYKPSNNDFFFGILRYSSACGQKNVMQQLKIHHWQP